MDINIILKHMDINIILKHMDIERSLIELPLCGTPYPMTLGKWTS